MYYGSGTVDRSASEQLVHMCLADATCALIR